MEYVDAALAAIPTCSRMLERLTLESVCPRCVLRHVSVRGAVYASEAPSTAAFLEAIRSRMQSTDQAGPSESEPAASAPAAPSAPADGAVCPACWGVLQALDGGSPGWSFDRIAAEIRSQGFAFSRYMLELYMPPALAVRQVSVAWELARILPADTTAAQEKRAGVISVKEALKSALAGALSPKLEAEPEVDSPLRVTLSFSHDGDEDETGFLNLRSPSQAGAQQGGRKRGGHWEKRQKTDASSAAAAAPVQGEQYQQAVKALSSLHNEGILKVARQGVYIGGYYVKEARGMCQSPWQLEGGTVIGDSSVQESIEKVLLPPLKADSCKFMSAGREDMDVRMLGFGRPFVFEIQNQRTAPPTEAECRALEEAIAAAHSGVTIRGLQPVSKAQRDMLVEGEGEKDKARLIKRHATTYDLYRRRIIRA